jgi:DNA-binding transcriptional MerR regulator
MQTPYTVPEIARLTGIPETTLYDYVRQFTGIVPEMEPADESGRTRRRYPEQAIAVFQTIRHLKDRGVDLPTIRALLQEGKRSDEPPAETEPSEIEHYELETEEPETVSAVSEPAMVEAHTEPAPPPASPETTAAGDAWSLASELANGAPYSPFFQVPVLVEPTRAPAPAEEVRAIVEQISLAEAATPAEPAPVTEPDGVIVLQERLLGGLEDGVRSLRELLDSQNTENNRLLDALKTERQQLEAERERLQKVQQENGELRSLLAGQKDQTRAAERLLALIKTHCEQGMQTIGE